jgi:hypothetical protein
VVKNVSGQFQGWKCKHSAPQNAECEGHVVLCERCASAVKNGAELLSDDDRQVIEAAKTSVTAVVKRAAAAAAGR